MARGIEAKRGKVREYDGQRFECVRIEPYIRRDGVMSSVAVWRSKCAACRTSFDFRSPLRVARFQPNRRCVRHRRPGQRVRPVAHTPVVGNLFG